MRTTEVPLDIEALKAAHRCFVTGVTVVTATLDGEPRGLVVNAFASISLTPPLVLVAINRRAATHDWIFAAGGFCVNVLAADQVAVARRFSTPIADKFAGVEWHRGINGHPVIDGSCATIEAQVQERAQARTHTVFIGHVLRADAGPAAPLVYYDAGFYDGAALDETIG